MQKGDFYPQSLNVGWFYCGSPKNAGGCYVLSLVYRVKHFIIVCSSLHKLSTVYCYNVEACLHSLNSGPVEFNIKLAIIDILM